MLTSTPEYLSAHVSELRSTRAAPGVRATMAQRRADRRRSMRRRFASFYASRPMRGRWRTARQARAVWVTILIVLALVAAACGGDDAGSSATTGSTATSPVATPATAPTTTTAPSTTTTLPPPIEITAVDYGFEGVPEVVPAGTRLGLVNASSDEFHMAAILLLEAGDDRTLDDFAALGADDILDENGDARFGTIRTVLLARPGEPHYFIPFGSPTVFNPGRYLVFDPTPVGADPGEMERLSEFGPPPQVEGVPAAFQMGMLAEFTVEG